MTIKTPLRYPGGKSRAVKVILPLIPEDCGELCSPFLGGGSIEIAASQRGMKVYGYDVFVPLVWFWEEILTRPDKVSNKARSYAVDVRSYTTLEKWVEEWNKFATKKQCIDNCRVHNAESTEYCNEHRKLESIINSELMGISEETFRSFQADLKGVVDPKIKHNITNAAKFFVINKAGRDGASLSGGYSWRASWDRYNESALNKLSNFNLEDFNVGYSDFEESIKKHPSAFLYLDPPYYLQKDKNKLYGTNGNLHEGFDHIRLYQTLKSVDNPFILSYNQSEFITTLYNEIGATCINLNNPWSYGMGDSKKSDEMIVTNLPEDEIRQKLANILNKEKGDLNGEEEQTEGGPSVDERPYEPSEQESGQECSPRFNWGQPYFSEGVDSNWLTVARFDHL